MDAADLVISDDCAERLGPQGVARVAAALHAERGDCQSCIKPLRGTRVSLVVDQMRPFPVASLHHESCRPSEWNDSGVRLLRARVAYPLTFDMSKWVLASCRGTHHAVVMLNPSLEEVMLHLVQQQWHPRLHSQYRKAGMRPSTSVDYIAPLAPGMQAVLTADGRVEVYTPSGDIFGGVNACPQEMIDLMAVQRVLVVAVTHAAAPSTLTDIADINRAMADPLTVRGTVSIRR